MTSSLAHAEDRADLLTQIAALHTAVVQAKAETAQALLNDAGDSATVTAANAALAEAQAVRDKAVEAAQEAQLALETLKPKPIETAVLAQKPAKPRS